MNDVRKRLGIIFMIIGLVGSLLLLFSSPISGPLIEFTEPPVIFLILYIPFTIIPLLVTLTGIFGCNFKTDLCEPEFFTGFFLNIVAFYLLGYLIGLIFFDKNK
jgi:uncharacterized integral membrane protein